MRASTRDLGESKGGASRSKGSQKVGPSRDFVGAIHFLRRMVQDLRTENDQLRRSLEQAAGAQSSMSLNSNGKRRMTDAYRFSSPHSSSGFLGPNRLTLPPDQNQPTFSNRAAPHHSAQMQTERPGSSLFAQQYAYNVHPPAHQAAAEIERIQPSFRESTRMPGSMLPPPTPQRSGAHTNGPNAVPNSGRAHRQAVRHRDIPPIAPTPSRSFDFPPQQTEGARSFRPPNASTSTHHAGSRHTGQGHDARVSTATASMRAGIPQTPSMGPPRPGRFVPSTNAGRTLGRSASLRQQSTQRTPFMPEAQFG